MGITSPEPDLTTFDETNPHRSESSANPLSFWERLEMFRYFFQAQSIGLERYTIVPFPINFPEKIANYAPHDAVHFLTIYDDWGRKKKKVLEAQGFHVEVLKEITLEEKKESGMHIRESIRAGSDAWKKDVPRSVCDYLIEKDLLSRL